VNRDRLHKSVSIVVDIQTISIAIASGGVFVAAIYYIFQIRHQTRLRQTDLVMRLYGTFTSNEYQDAWTKVRKKASDVENQNDIYDFDKETEIRKEFNQVTTFWEGVAVLFKRKVIDITMIEDLFGNNIARVWEKVKPGVVKMRQQFNDPTICSDFEYLYNEWKKRQQKLQATA
jgi:hypothetical protein